MIKDMIVKLMEEANDEAEHKGWCDTELSTNKQTRDTKTTEAGELQATIEQWQSEAETLAAEIATLAGEMASIAQAVTVLKDFYNKAAMPAEVVSPPKGGIAWDPRIYNHGISLLQG